MSTYEEAKAVLRYAIERNDPPKLFEVGKEYEEMGMMVTCIDQQIEQLLAFKVWRVTFRRHDGTTFHSYFNTYPDKPSYDTILEIIRNATNPKE